MSAPIMPADFTIESITDIQKKQEGDAAAFAAAHPDLALWRQIRDALTGADGDKYFADSLKDAGIPPDGGAFKMFTGKVISQPDPKSVLLSVDNVAGDVTLSFENPLKGTLDPGTEVHFKGFRSIRSCEGIHPLHADAEGGQGRRGRHSGHRVCRCACACA